MYCKKCGQEINENAIICPHCGVATDNMSKTAPVPAQKNTIALVGFILSFFVPMVGLILSIIGYQNVKKPEYAGDGRSFAVAGIAISAVYLGIALICVVFYFVIVFGLLMMLPIAY